MDDYTSNMFPLSRVKTTSTQEQDCVLYGGLNISVMQVKAIIEMFVGRNAKNGAIDFSIIFRVCRGWDPPPTGAGLIKI